MKRYFSTGLFLACLCAFAVSNAFAVGVVKTRLVAEGDAQTVGLTRAWFAQATLDPEREEVSSATIQDGLLMVTSESGFLQAIDAESGTVLWSVLVGDGYLTTPAVNSKIVAVACGAKLLIYDRRDGKKLDETDLRGLPAAGPMATERFIYVPLFSERIHIYPIKKIEPKLTAEQAKIEGEIANLQDKATAEKLTAKIRGAREEREKNEYAIESLAPMNPKSCPTLGFSLTPPIIATQVYERDYISFTTHDGWLMVADASRSGEPTLLHRLHIAPLLSYVNHNKLGNSLYIPRDDVANRPFFYPVDVTQTGEGTPVGGLLFVGSETGDMYAMNDITGELRWKFLTPTPVSNRIAAVENVVYVPTESGEFFAVEMKEGKQIWVAEGISEFLSVSASRVYALDTLGRLAILSKADGRRLKTLQIGANEYCVFNANTDRVYLVSADGLVQCFRETQQTEPIQYVRSCAEYAAEVLKKPAQAEEAAEPAKKVVAPAQAADDEEESADVEESVDEDDPFGDDADDSAATGKTPAQAAVDEDDDPFGDDADDSAAPAKPAEKAAPAPAEDDEEDPFAYLPL